MANQRGSIGAPGGATVFKRRKPEDVPTATVAKRDSRQTESHAATQAGSLLPGQTPGQTAPPAGRAEPGSGPLAALTGQPSDPGIGVPPFRPAPSKETPMSRTPLTPPPTTMPPAGGQGALAGGLAAGAMTRPAGRLGREDSGERRTLVVGRGISVQGTVQDAERLVVEGTVEASMIHATELAIAPGGVFKGEVEVEDAEIAGTIDGTLTARGSLIIRASGRVLGTARCRRLQVEDGGQITGRIEMLGDTVRPEIPRGEIPRGELARGEGPRPSAPESAA